MTKFADDLYDDLLRQHGPMLADTRPHAATARPSAARRVVLAAGTGGVAVAATVGGLVATSGTPAYALTTNQDGTVSLAVYQQPGIAQANAKLTQLGDRVVVVPVRAGCPSITSLRPPAVKPDHPMSVETRTRDGSITVQAQGIPAGDIMVVGVVTSTHGQATMSMTAGRLTSGPAPSCISLPKGPRPPAGPGSSGHAGSGGGSGPVTRSSSGGSAGPATRSSSGGSAGPATTSG
ncbi:MAG: hypothetical protein JO016_18865 [Actinobacteria bacterium]|nr:hypothetical protein [Actinomycetota bacterium]